MTARHDRPARRWPDLVVALSFLLLACVVYWPVVPWSSNRVIDCACSDPVQEIWFLHWTAWAPLHGHNPFLTDYLNAPHGANLAINTSFPLLGAIGAPITWLAGPVVTYNLLLRLALATSAFAMYAVMRRYAPWRPAAYAAGLLYGFSPYMIGHAHRHVFLTFVPLLPLLIPVADDWLVRPRRDAYRSGVLVGLLLAGEYLISPEVALIAAGVVVLGLLVIAWRYRGLVRERLVLLGRGCITTVAVGALLAGYPAYLLLFGPQRPRGAIHDTSVLYLYHGDAAAPVVPTTGEYFAPAHSGADLPAGVTENGLYLGIPLLVLLVLAAWRFWGIALVRAATVVGVVGYVLSLGTALTVNGHRKFGHLPFGLIGKIPVVQNIEPARMSFLMQWGAAVLLGIGLDRWHATGWRRTARPHTRRALRAIVVSLVGVAALLPLVPRLPLYTARLHVPALFTSDDVRQIPAGSLALTYPYGFDPYEDPMIWQFASGMRFRIFGGEAFVPDEFGHSTWSPMPPSPPDISQLLLAYQQPSEHLVGDAGLVERVRDFLRRYRVQVILVDPAWQYAADVALVFSDALHRPPARLGEMYVWLGVPSSVGR